MIAVIKSVLRGLLRLLYRVEVRGLEHFHAAGRRVLIIANHSSLLDGLLLYAWLPETPTFAINTQIASRPMFRPFLRFVDLFQMDPLNPLSVKSMIRFIQDNRKALVFPEGRITVTGIPMKVYEGPGLVADKADAMVLPIAIEGAQYSPFSYLRGKLPIRWFPKIRLHVLPPERIALDPSLHGHARRKAAGMAMQKLMLRIFFATYDHRRTLFEALIDTAHRSGMGFRILEDVSREPLTFRQFLTRILVLARAIGGHSARGERVGVLLPNVIATPVVFMALQFLGRVAAMLNFTAGPQAVLQACATGEIRLVYTSRKFIETAGLQKMVRELEAVLKVFYLEDLRAQIGLFDRIRGLLSTFTLAQAYRSAGADRSPDGGAVLLFTSGSEGRPKGVLLSHANLLSNYAQVRCLIDFKPSDLMFSCLPLFHSFGLNGGLLMPLLGGSRVFLYPTPLHYRIIPELIYELGATILFGTNTFFRGYARYAHPYDFQTLRYTVAGAEKLWDETLRLWMEKFGIRILQGYGVTEASPVLAVNTPLNHVAGTIGLLLPGVDHYLAPVQGISEGGRLVVRGPNVMLGYLLHGTDGLRPPATERGEGWYDTGDIATVDELGFVRILGRAKRFAKIGGEMISLAAVEELALQTWPKFTHAACSLQDETKGEKIVLVTDNPAATRKQIQETARELKYGELYIPKQVLLTEEVPLLGTGKVDYVTLQERLKSVGTGDGDWLSRLSRIMSPDEPGTLPPGPADGTGAS